MRVKKYISILLVIIILFSFGCSNKEEIIDNKNSGTNIESSLNDQLPANSEDSSTDKEKIIQKTEESVYNSYIFGLANDGISSDGKKIEGVDWWGFEETIKNNVPDRIISFNGINCECYYFNTLKYATQSSRIDVYKAKDGSEYEFWINEETDSIIKMDAFLYDKDNLVSWEDLEYKKESIINSESDAVEYVKNCAADCFKIEDINDYLLIRCKTRYYSSPYYSGEKDIGYEITLSKCKSGYMTTDIIGAIIGKSGFIARLGNYEPGVFDGYSFNIDKDKITKTLDKKIENTYNDATVIGNIVFKYERYEIESQQIVKGTEDSFHLLNRCRVYGKVETDGVKMDVESLIDIDIDISEDVIKG